jgi:hypothetical protein
MRSASNKVRSVLALALAGIALTALEIGGACPAAAQFRIGGFGHMGNFGARPRGPVVARPRWTARTVERPYPRHGRPPRLGSGETWRHHRLVTIDRGRPASPAARTSGNGGGVPPRGQGRFVPDQVIVQFSANASARAIGRLARRFDLNQIEGQSFPLIGARLSLWHIRGRLSVLSVVGALQYQNIVARVQPNYIFALQGQDGNSATEAHGDPAQYVLSKLQVEQAQRIATGAKIPVAVIDSEIDAKHPDLDGSIVKSFDALRSDDRPELHGTEMAGAIASHGKLLGIAPGVQLLAACAFDGRSGGTSFAIYKSLQWAADNGARIINMSFAGPEDPTLHRMLAAAAARDIVLIAAAGNAGPDSPPLYPAADPDVIAVTATDIDDRLFKMANRGPYIAVAAPGVEVLALAPGDAYQITTGTSVAAAHVSGIAALLLQHDPSLTPADVRSILLGTARAVQVSGGGSGFDPGLVNAYRALTSPVKSVGTEAAHEQAKR